MLYGKPYPPKYSLKNTTAPVALIWGPNDAVVSPVVIVAYESIDIFGIIFYTFLNFLETVLQDVMRLASELPNLVFNNPVNFSLWNHFDYHLGKDANQLVNENVLRILSTF